MVGLFKTELILKRGTRHPLSVHQIVGRGQAELQQQHKLGAARVDHVRLTVVGEEVQSRVDRHRSVELKGG